jgi:hypothetical protein
MAMAPSAAVNPLAGSDSQVQCKCMAKQGKSREERLAEALRENLRRRKAQARDITRPDDPEKAPPDSNR